MAVGFRLCKQKYLPLNPDGARAAGGRWNSKGVPAVYLSESISLAVLEVTVHATELPDEYCLTEILMDDAIIESLPLLSLPVDWREPAQARALRRIGDLWNSQKRSAVLRVPSIIVPQEANFVVNTEHPDFPSIQQRDLGFFHFDRRLRPRLVDLTHDG